MVCVTGCVSTKKFNALQANYNELQGTTASLPGKARHVEAI